MMKASTKPYCYGLAMKTLPLTHVLNTLFLAGYTIWGAVETLEV